jgi:hypothetical protein
MFWIAAQWLIAGMENVLIRRPKGDECCHSMSANILASKVKRTVPAGITTSGPRPTFVGFSANDMSQKSMNIAMFHMTQMALNSSKVKE